MDLITYISLFLSYQFVFSKVNKRQKFVIEKDKSVEFGLQHIEQFKAESVISCATQCRAFVNCCSASYDDFERNCSLYSCCFPKTLTSVGVKYIRISPNKDALSSIKPKDCNELPPGSDNDVYTIYPTSSFQMDVYCDMRLECGIGWTVIQRRIDGSTDFYANWTTYEKGFGNASREYWIGNENLHVLTAAKSYTLQFDMQYFDGISAYSEYTTFKVGDETTKYKLSIGGYRGTSEDSMTGTYSLNNMLFTTFDQDNDPSDWRNCAKRHKSGWWFRDCSHVNANGLYKQPGADGPDCIYWRDLRGYLALKSISMKLKPN